MSIDGTYEISIEVDGKPQTAQAEIKTNGSELVATARNVPLVNTISAKGTINPDGSFVMAGELRVLFKKMSYNIVGVFENDRVSATCESNMGNFVADGVRIS